MSERRDFLKLLAFSGAGAMLPAECGITAREALAATPQADQRSAGSYAPGRIPNEFALYLPGEEESLKAVPRVYRLQNDALQNDGLLARLGTQSARLKPGEAFSGWTLMTIASMNGVVTAVFEKHVTHRGAIAYVTEDEGTIAWIPKYVGSLPKVRPRPTNTSDGVALERPSHYVPGPDVTGDYILRSSEDPCYENIAALGPEYTGWTLVANEEGGPAASLYLDAAGKSREMAGKPGDAATREPDLLGALFNPADLLPDENPQLFAYMPGYSKRTLLGGYLPVADTGVWNPHYKCGYEALVLLPPGADARPMARVRYTLPAFQQGESHPSQRRTPESDGRVYVDRYWNCNAAQFFSELAGIWNRWSSLYETAMPVDIPDEWLLNAARAGITLSHCSYRGLEPTYQIGEGAYTKIPERSHALFPVAHYEFIWAQQLWNLTGDADAYFQHYLDKYIMANGDWLYNTQDQVEAPLNTGIVLSNSARAYEYTQNLAAFKARLPILERMIAFVLARYEYSKQTFAPGDRRYGLIYGSPEADLGDPHNDFPRSHPLYYQNSACIWRGLHDHARCLRRAGRDGNDAILLAAADRYDAVAKEMRGNIEASLAATLALRAPDMKAAGITPFTPDDIDHRPKALSSYENHRLMQDWFLADWGDPQLDLGHLRHRELAGMQILGLHTDGAWCRTSNFMDHGSLSVKIRQEDYRPFLLNLYALVCYAADSGNRYSPEDALLPGGFPGEGSPYGWSAVINSALQPTVGLRWLLCYEDSTADLCHLQKAAPRHWFAAGKTIAVKRCPTRFGVIGWQTKAVGDHRWKITLDIPANFTADLQIHVHPSDGKPLTTATIGAVSPTHVLLSRILLAGKSRLDIEVS